MQFKSLKLGKSQVRLGKSKKYNPKKLVPFVLVIAVLTSLAIFLTTLSGSSSVVEFISEGKNLFLFSSNNLKSSGSRVNILLLGIAGGMHDGGNLTDTIMVASYNLKTNQVYLFSIPRDLWLPSLKSKANAVYEIGRSQNKQSLISGENNDLGLAKTIMGNVLGIPIHYGLRVDFRGFVKALDAIDGIDVEVERSFDDYLYPIAGKENDLCGNEEKEMDFNEEEAKKLNIEPGKKQVLITADGKIATDSAEEDKGIKYFSCRYEHVSFDKGEMEMSGAIALVFVRSRHGTNEEGSDFSRSKRQQKVLEATRNKILSLETLANPQKVGDLVKALGKSIDTDISVKEAIEFYKLSKNLAKTSNFVLDDSPKANLPAGRTSLLIHPSSTDYGGAYVLISQDDDFSIVQGYVRKILKGEITEYDATAAARTR